MSRPTITTPSEYKMDHHGLALKRDKNSKQPELTWQDYELSPISPPKGVIVCGTGLTILPEVLERLNKTDQKVTIKTYVE